MRRGFTIIEGLLSTIVVGVMMVAAVRVVAASRMIQFKNASRVQASLLAERLLVEIVSKPYEDSASPAFGLEAGEPSTLRSAFDDVDDYDGWSEMPPQEPDGTPMAGMAHWKREVQVERVAPANVAGGAAILETGAKRVTVRVSLRGVPIVTAVAIRTKAR